MENEQGFGGQLAMRGSNMTRADQSAAGSGRSMPLMDQEREAMTSIRQHSILLAIVLASNLVVAGVQARPSVSCPIRSTTDFVYYSGSGASSLSQSWMVHFLDWWKAQDSSIEYLKLSAAEVAACDMTDETKYPDLDMYIQPGGDAYLAQRAIGASGKSRINAFLASNGSYFGACAGWYFAANDYMWQDAYYQHPNLLGAYPATVEGSIKEIADYDVGTGYAVASLVRSLDPDQNTFPALYWGGPTRGRLYTSNDGNTGNVDASFFPSQLPAVVKSGNMLLTSVHLEAYENDGFTGLTTAEREANYRYLAGLVNEVAGTTFLVPAPPEPPLPPPPGPQELFADSFEQGFTWVTSGPGTAWSIRTDNVADGWKSLVHEARDRAFQLCNPDVYPQACRT
jgi:glutamine amidotransferase-like uncharacterized protein